MHADLCRRLVTVMESPAYLGYIALMDDPGLMKTRMEQACVEAYTEDKLPEEIREFFQDCDRSIEIANQKGFRYPYTQSQIEQVMEAMSNGN